MNEPPTPPTTAVAKPAGPLMSRACVNAARRPCGPTIFQSTPTCQALALTSPAVVSKRCSVYCPPKRTGPQVYAAPTCQPLSVVLFGGNAPPKSLCCSKPAETYSGPAEYCAPIE